MSLQIGDLGPCGSALMFKWRTQCLPRLHCIDGTAAFGDELEGRMEETARPVKECGLIPGNLRPLVYCFHSLTPPPKAWLSCVSP